MRAPSIENCSKAIDRIAALQAMPGPSCNVESLQGLEDGTWSDDPFPIQPKFPGLPDLIGRKRGQGICVGFFGSIHRGEKSKKNKKRKGAYRHYWILKCSCGGFQLIKQQTLLSKEGNPWMCLRCSRIRDIKRGFGTYKKDLMNAPRLTPPASLK